MDALGLPALRSSPEAVRGLNDRRITMKYWLMKSEPEAFSIDDLAKAPKKTTCWDGVRNYQARKFMRSMEIGDQVFFYHSSVEPACVVGVAEVVKKAYPDHTALDQKDEHFDPKATPANPICAMVDMKVMRKFDEPMTLEDPREAPGLEKMELLRRGSHLSVQPVTAAERKIVNNLAEKKATKKR